jgi:hypothetical protein
MGIAIFFLGLILELAFIILLLQFPSESLLRDWARLLAISLSGFMLMIVGLGVEVLDFIFRQERSSGKQTTTPTEGVRREDSVRHV